MVDRLPSSGRAEKCHAATSFKRLLSTERPVTSRFGRAFFFQTLQSFGLIDAQAAALLLPAIVGVFRDTEFATGVAHRETVAYSISIVRKCPMISSAVYRFRAIASPFSGQRASRHRRPGLKGEGHRPQ